MTRSARQTSTFKRLYLDTRNPISELQYQAGLRFVEDHTVSDGMGANTQTACALAEQITVPRNRDGAPACADGRLLASINRRRRYDALAANDRALLGALLIKEMTLAAIAKATQWTGRKTARAIRQALDHLVTLLETTDKVFAEVVATIRQAENATKRAA